MCHRSFLLWCRLQTLCWQNFRYWGLLFSFWATCVPVLDAISMVEGVTRPLLCLQLFAINTKCAYNIWCVPYTVTSLDAALFSVVLAYLTSIFKMSLWYSYGFASSSNCPDHGWAYLLLNDTNFAGIDYRWQQLQSFKTNALNVFASTRSVTVTWSLGFEPRKRRLVYNVLQLLLNLFFWMWDVLLWTSSQIFCLWGYSFDTTTTGFIVSLYNKQQQ